MHMKCSAICFADVCLNSVKGYRKRLENVIVQKGCTACYLFCLTINFGQTVICFFVYNYSKVNTRRFLFTYWLMLYNRYFISISVNLYYSMIFVMIYNKLKKLDRTNNFLPAVHLIIGVKVNYCYSNNWQRISY